MTASRLGLGATFSGTRLYTTTSLEHTTSKYSASAQKPVEARRAHDDLAGQNIARRPRVMCQRDRV